MALCVCQSVYYAEAVFFSFFVISAAGLYVAAKFVPYLTVATLTNVAFLRSSKIQKLPASKEQNLLKMKGAVSGVQKPQNRPSRRCSSTHAKRDGDRMTLLA